MLNDLQFAKRQRSLDRKQKALNRVNNRDRKRAGLPEDHPDRIAHDQEVEALSPYQDALDRWADRGEIPFYMLRQYEGVRSARAIYRLGVLTGRLHVVGMTPSALPVYGPRPAKRPGNKGAGRPRADLTRQIEALALGESVTLPHPQAADQYIRGIKARHRAAMERRAMLTRTPLEGLAFRRRGLTLTRIYAAPPRDL